MDIPKNWPKNSFKDHEKDTGLSANMLFSLDKYQFY